jgi:hypothetical protein
MAKASVTNAFDYSRFSIKFDNGVKLSGSYGRGGHSIKIEPLDLVALRRVSSVLDFAFEAGLRVIGSGYTLGDMLKIVAASADKARTLDDFVSGFQTSMKSRYGVDFSGTETLQPREETEANVTKAGRGWLVAARFSNGDEFDMKVNGSSIGPTMRPAVSGLVDVVTSLTFDVIKKYKDAQKVAEVLAATARSASDVVSWIDGIQAELDGRAAVASIPKSDEKLLAKARNVLAKAAADPVKAARLHPDAVKVLVEAFEALVSERDALRGGAGA